MPQVLDLRVTHRMHARHAGCRKPRPGDEIDALDIPRLGNRQSVFKDLVLYESTPLPSPDPHQAWQGGARPSRTPRAGLRPSLTAERRLAEGNAGRDGGMVSLDRTKG